MSSPSTALLPVLLLACLASLTSLLPPTCFLVLPYLAIDTLRPPFDLACPDTTHYPLIAVVDACFMHVQVPRKPRAHRLQLRERGSNGRNESDADPIRQPLPGRTGRWRRQHLIHSIIFGPGNECHCRCRFRGEGEGRWDGKRKSRRSRPRRFKSFSKIRLDYRRAVDRFSEHSKENFMGIFRRISLMGKRSTLVLKPRSFAESRAWQASTPVGRSIAATAIARVVAMTAALKTKPKRHHQPLTLATLPLPIALTSPPPLSTVAMISGNDHPSSPSFASLDAIAISCVPQATISASSWSSFPQTELEWLAGSSRQTSWKIWFPGEGR
ncbi:hypothetical protein IWX49DRAFT_640776 [Phyllosticta citricarpa]